MIKLADLQKEFADQIYDRNKTAIYDQIKDQGTSIQRRLQVYRNNILGSFDDVLESIYEVTKKLVGDEYFKNLSIEYNQKYRSETGNLDDYGSYFPNLISSLQKNHKLLYLKDIAKLEWLYHRAYFSRDVKNLNIKKLQSLKEDEYFKVQFCLHPSCSLMSSSYPIYTIWEKTQKKSKKTININNLQREFILIERANFETNIHNLSEVEYSFLQNIKKGYNIYNIYESLTKGNYEFDIGSLVNKYISISALSSFKLN